MSNNSKQVQSNRRGAMLVLIAVCLPLIVIMAAFAVDVAWMQLVRTELRSATDAAARAAAKELSMSQDTAIARARAKEVAARNQVASQGLQLADADIVFGAVTQSGELSRFEFAPGGNRFNAVRVTGRRTDGSVGGPVNLLFAGVLGVDVFEPQHTATSAQIDRDICLVVDRSGSMMRGLFGRNIPGGQCQPPHPTRSRWGTLSTAVTAFLAELEKTRQEEMVGLVSYSSNDVRCGFTYRISEINSEVVRDYGVIRNEMNRIGSRPVQGFTSISAGIDDGIRVLTSDRTRPFAVRTMVLMTDGRHNTGPEPIISARRAVPEGIVIHTITFSSEADIGRMRAVAAATGGQHFHAPNEEELIRIFKEIAATMPVLLTE